MNASLLRTRTGDSGTFGKLVLKDGTVFVTGELPWRDNKPRISCIPTGHYLCALYPSPTHGPVFQVLAVPGRDNIEIHAANWFGDKAKGFQAQMLGCIGLGMTFGVLGGQDAILNSAVAVRDFMAKQQGQPFDLTINEAFA